MKKILTILLTVFMAFSFVPSEKLTAENTITKQQVMEYVPDPVFAEAIVNAFNAANFDTTGMTVLQALKAFNGSVMVSKDSGLGYIQSIEGIQYLENATINLNEMSITDLSPIGKFKTGTTKPVTIGSSPINKWPTSFPNKDGESWLIPNPFKLQGEAVYLNDGTQKTQHIVYDVFVGGETTDIDADNKVTKYITTGASQPSKEQPAAADRRATFYITGPATSESDIAIPTWNYTSDDVDYALTPRYYYTVTSKFYYLLKVSDSANTVGGFKILKYAEGDANKTPLPGATFKVEDSNGNEIDGSPFTTTEANPIITVTGLPAGTYTVTETAAPEGFKVNSTPKTVTIAAAESNLTVTGGKSSVSVNKDTETWTPEWSTGFVEYNSDKEHIQLKPSSERQNVTAASKGAKAIIANNDVDATVPVVAITVGATSNKYTVSNTSVKVTMGTSTVGDNMTAEAAATAINNLMTNNGITDDVNVSVSGTFQLKEEEYETVEIANKKFTIWIENTTGDEGKYEKNDGGWVQVLGDTGTEKNKVSSDGKDNNDKNRKTECCTKGIADKENGWKVDLDRMAIGPKGNGHSGATYKILDYADETGHFEIELPDGSYIRGYYEYDEENETVVICVDCGNVVLDRDIDVAVAFKRVVPTPPTGDTYNLSLYVFGAVASLAVCLFLYRKSRLNA